MFFFISLPGCCVFSGKDDRLIDVLLRVEDFAPPVARKRITIFNTNNNKDLAPPVARMITTISTTTKKTTIATTETYVNVLPRVEDLAPPDKNKNYNL